MPIKSNEIPRAKLRRRATLSAIWLVPLMIGIAAAILVFNQINKIGPSITIQFADGSGIEPNQTVVRFRGVRVGSVKSVQISKDANHVDVGVRLNHNGANLAREGTIFWVVRPEVGAGGVHALETIVSGPYIQAQPRNVNGKKQNFFIGANEPPPVRPPGDGKEFVLRSPGVSSLSPGSPVFYRGIEVGSVEYLTLSEDSTMVSVHVLIKNKFTLLVRTNTVWWNAGGINVNLYLFGMNLNAENLKSLIVGGIAFATPNNAGPPANDGTPFTLFEKADPEWLKWAAVISITNAVITALPTTPAAAPAVNLDNNNLTPKQ